MKSCFQKFPLDKDARARCFSERNLEGLKAEQEAKQKIVQNAWDAEQERKAIEEAKKNGTYVDPNIDVNAEANELIRKEEKAKKRKYLIIVGSSIVVLSAIAFFVIRKINK
jgi:NAD-dependent SIR2 family protein deacetylase